MTGALQVVHIKSQVGTRPDGQYVINLSCSGQTNTVRLDLTERIPPQLHQSQPLPCAIIAAQRWALPHMFRAPAAVN
jgi:hypothetical protein